jgi:hypothetical protein
VRAAAVVFATVVLATVAGCGSSGSSRARFTTWTQAAAGLRPALDPHSPDPCERGDVSCLGLLLAEMHRRDDAESAACVHRALFTRLYLGTTEALRAAVRAGRFRHGAAIVHFGAWFARLALKAEDAWESGRVESVPAAWRVAFAAEDGRRVRSIGDLLLGMNAHISRDLAFTVAAVEHGHGSAVDPDFELFTNVIEAKSAPAIAGLAQRFDPALALVEVPLALGGARTVGQLVGAWRDEAWRNGIALRDARGAARAAVAARIERVAQLRAEEIVAATAYLPIVQSSRSRDAYCAAQTERFRTRPGGNMGTSDKGG